MTLGEACEGRTNNFDLVRFVAASAVLVSHAYPLTGRADEPVARLTGLDTLGGFAVNIFFVLSGFLITQSFTRTPSLARFVEARALRLLPGLVLVTVFGVLLGATQTTLPAGEFFSSPKTWTFFRSVLLDIQYELPGVFEGNPAARAVNGSLWTLPGEVAMYAVTATLGVMTLLAERRVAAVSLLVIGAWLVVAPQTFPILPSSNPSFVTPSLSYVVGAMFFVLRDRVPLSWKHAGAFVFVAWLLRDGPNGRLLAWVAVAYVTLWVCLAHPRFSRFGKYGDFSYGMYLFAFPVQQLVVARGWASTPLGLVVVAFPLTLGLAVASWHLVERRALSLKGRLVRRDDQLRHESALDPGRARA